MKPRDSDEGTDRAASREPLRSGRLRARRYDFSAALGDLAGGAIAALIALPYGLAMAKLMGLPPELGVWTSLLTAPITAALGRNPVLIGGTASATVPFVAAAVRHDGLEGAAKICIVAAIFTMMFGLLRLGRHIARVPHAVISGFSCGIGIHMVVSQLHVILGLSTTRLGRWAGALGELLEVLSRLDESRTRPFLLGLMVILGAWGAMRIWPRGPLPLFGITIAASSAALLNWREPILGELSFDLPTSIVIHWRLDDLIGVLPSALGLAFVSSINLLVTSRVVEHFRGRHNPLRGSDADAELGAYGVANLVAGAFAAPPSVGIPARSLASIRCGGLTRLANLWHAAVILALTRLGSGAIAAIPLAALAGVTAFVGLGLLEWSVWRRLPKMRRVDAAAFLATAIIVPTWNAVAAVTIGCGLYALRAAVRKALARMHGTK